MHKIHFFWPFLRASFTAISSTYVCVVPVSDELDRSHHHGGVSKGLIVLLPFPPNNACVAMGCCPQSIQASVIHAITCSNEPPSCLPIQSNMSASIIIIVIVICAEACSCGVLQLIPCHKKSNTVKQVKSLLRVCAKPDI